MKPDEIAAAAISLWFTGNDERSRIAATVRERAPNNRVPVVSSPTLPRTPPSWLSRSRRWRSYAARSPCPLGVRPTTTSICDGSLSTERSLPSSAV